MKNIKIAVPLAAMLFCGSAHAAEAPAYFEGSGSLSGLVEGLRAESVRAGAPAVPAPQPAQPGTPNNEQLHFWEDLKSDVFDDVCRDVQIELNEGAVLDNVGGIEGNFKRYLKAYPDNSIALIDEVGVKLEGGYTLADHLNIEGGTFHIGFKTSLEGKSVVVRRTGETAYCKNLLTVLDLRKVKTVIPVNEKRIGAMKAGEIWKLPAILRAEVSGGAAVSPQPLVTVSFSMGSARELKPSVTLFKMDENRLRLRLRLDRMNIKSAAISAGVSVDAGLLGLPEAEGPMMEALNKSVMKELNRYLALKLGLTHKRAKGKKLLLEFMVNPKDPAQVAALAEFLKGDWGVIKRLIELGARFNDFSASDGYAAGEQALQDVSGAAGGALGLNSTFAASDHYTSVSNGTNFNLPVLLHSETTSGQRYDRYQVLGGESVLHVHNSSRKESVSNINTPLTGKMFKHNTDQNFYVVNNEDKNGVVSDAAVVYQRYEGYVNHDERDARGMLRDMNEILKYAGTRGEGVNNAFLPDVDALFPRLAAAEAAPHHAQYGIPTVKSEQYGSAFISFSLVFTRQAVRDILATPALTLMKAVLNVMEGVDREVLDKVSHLFRMDGDKVAYDWKAMNNILCEYAHYGGGNINPLAIVDNFCMNAGNIIADIAGVRAEGDQKARSERLSRVLAGKGKSRLGYENMLQVLVQLVDVKDIHAQLDVRTHKGIKGEEDIASGYSLFNNSLQPAYGVQLAEATALRDSFTDTTALSD